MRSPGARKCNRPLRSAQLKPCSKHWFQRGVVSRIVASKGGKGSGALSNCCTSREEGRSLHSTAKVAVLPSAWVRSRKSKPWSGPGTVGSTSKLSPGIEKRAASFWKVASSSAPVSMVESLLKMEVSQRGEGFVLSELAY
jgi:hypothetical protein